MSVTMQSILRAATRKKNEPLNIISINQSERYQSYLANTGHNFYVIGKRWNHSKAQLPENVKELFHLENGLKYDLVFCYGRERGFEEAASISYKYHIPLILFEKDLPNPNKQTKIVNGDVNVFISHLQAKAWKCNDYQQVNNCVDSNLFALEDTVKDNDVLICIENWMRRDWSHGFRLWHRHKNNTQAKISNFVSWQQIVEEYNKSKIYFNPTILVPQPFQILEAFACGCIVIAIDNDFNKEIIKDGVNGFLTTPEKIPEKIKEVLSLNVIEASKIIAHGANTLNNHNLNKFTAEWQDIFRKACDKPFIGRRI